jgi:hypothetical protein
VLSPRVTKNIFQTLTSAPTFCLSVPVGPVVDRLSLVRRHPTQLALIVELIES